VITIGQLADYAGVTIKAVRHYHQRGLLAEPPRDASGYRRYTAQHAVELVKIRTLAEAGVPLARIDELLAAEPDRFSAAIIEIDRQLRERADELLRTRERLAQLKQEAITSPEFQAIYLEYDAAFDLSPTDSRLRALAERMARWMTNRPAPAELPSAEDARLATLIAASVGAVSPAWNRIAELTGG